MTYVWLTDTSGKRRYVNDDYLSPCYECGEKISVCQDNGCLDADKGCANCNVEKSSQCHCDNDYEGSVGK